MSDTCASREIRPFTFEFPDTELEELRRKIEATRFPEKETVQDQSQGTQLADPVHARLRLLRHADHNRLEPRAHGTRLGRADNTSRLHQVRSAGGNSGAIVTDVMTPAAT
ncbi:epoxide hydrolase N-terminal domain-containing protein [Streptomyces cadmiisoli]|uniref:epoxide hydrolase N-terminal domain-containing protein n=1 Tax=Streptomyces cadmiisoli TaxID=2184053 RepID=UPI003648EBCB